MAHISNEMISPELRPTGKLVRKVLPRFTPSSIIWANRVTDMLKGVNYTHLHYEQHQLRRPDGSLLRICVYKPRHTHEAKNNSYDKSFSTVKAQFGKQQALNTTIDEWKTADSISMDESRPHSADHGADTNHQARVLRQQSHGLHAGAPGLLWIHGGGFALENPELEAFYFEKIVDATGAVLVAPDYRKSTEAPYPAALEDCYWTLLWMKEHSDALGIHSNQLVVAGASAGGSLTAAVSLLARDRGDVNIAFQVPICPMLDDRETESSCDNDAPVWNTASNRLCWNMYLGKLRGTDSVPSYAAPARAKDLAGLPPTLSFVGDIEPFHDETVSFIQRLTNTGVETKFRVFPGAFHVFDALVPNAKVSKAATKFLLDGFRDGLKQFTAEQS